MNIFLIPLISIIYNITFASVNVQDLIKVFVRRNLQNQRDGTQFDNNKNAIVEMICNAGNRENEICILKNISKQKLNLRNEEKLLNLRNEEKLLKLPNEAKFIIIDTCENVDVLSDNGSVFLCQSYKDGNIYIGGNIESGNQIKNFKPEKSSLKKLVLYLRTCRDVDIHVNCQECEIIFDNSNHANVYVYDKKAKITLFQYVQHSDTISTLLPDDINEDSHYILQRIHDQKTYQVAPQRRATLSEHLIIDTFKGSDMDGVNSEASQNTDSDSDTDIDRESVQQKSSDTDMDRESVQQKSRSFIKPSSFKSKILSSIQKAPEVIRSFIPFTIF